MEKQKDGLQINRKMDGWQMERGMDGKWKDRGVDGKIEGWMQGWMVNLEIDDGEGWMGRWRDGKDWMVEEWIVDEQKDGGM